VLYSNPDCKAQCKDLPYNAEYPSHGHQKSGISIIEISALIGARDNELLWYSSDEPNALKLFVHNPSLPPEVWLILVAVTTPLAIVKASKITTRKIRISR
jgi:hypothetical protein